MSSAHTYISNSEIKRLREAASRTYQAEKMAQDLEARAVQREREITSQYRSSIKSLNSKINEVSQQQDADRRRLSEDFRKKLAGQAAMFQEQLESEREETREGFKRVHSDLGKIKKTIRDMDENFTGAINEFSNRFIALANKEADKRKSAETLLAEIEDMLKGVAALNPEKYNAGGLFAQMTEQLTIAKNSCAQGLYEAAIGQANTRLTDIAALQQRLALENTLFNTLLAEAREATNYLRMDIAWLTDGKPAHSFPHNKEIITLPYDIDHWTNGRFGDFCRELDEIERRLAAAESDPAMGLEQLEEIRVRLSSWSGDNGYLHALDEEGKQRQISSIAVDEMTAHLYEALEEKGLRLVDSGRLNEDDRNGCSITYEDNVGNRIVLVVNPDKNDPSVTPIIFDVFANGEDNVDSENTRAIENDIAATIGCLQGEEVDHGKTVFKKDCQQNPTPEAFVQNNATNVNREQGTRA